MLVMMKNWIGKIKHNHGLLMLICCGIPLLLLVGARTIFGLSKNYLLWFIFLLCPILHYFMMKDMHNKNSKDSGKKCH